MKECQSIEADLKWEKELQEIEEDERCEETFSKIPLHLQSDYAAHFAKTGISESDYLVTAGKLVLTSVSLFTLLV